MHRSPLGTLTSALALLVTALVVPHGSAFRASAGASSKDLVAVASVTVRPAALPVQLAQPVRSCRSGLIALTFDDGPSSSVTPGLVRTLRRLEVPATFFMVGSRVRSAPEVARKVQSAGFQIANHTWSHRQLTALPDRVVRGELVRTRHEFRSQRIVPSGLMRPPYGATNRRVGKDIRALGLVPVLWTIDSMDWSGGGPAQIASRVLGALHRKGTNIVLQHDGVTNSPNSVKAVPKIVAGARRRGYCFANLGPHGGVAKPVPQVRATVVPGNEHGPNALRIRLDLDRATTRAVSFRLQTVSATAQSGSDFTPRSGLVTFPAGVRTAWLSVPVIDDHLVEPSEDLRVLLDQPTGVTIAHGDVLGTILSDDQPWVNPPRLIVR